MYCPECGLQNNEAANYCQRCGAHLVSEASAGQTTMAFTPPDVEPEEDTDAIEEEGPGLVIRAGGGRAGEHFALRGDCTIGRSERADVLLDDITVSRVHARVVRRPDGLWIEDADSLNGTYVNRRRIESHRLADGDEVQIGKFKLTYLDR